jgi:hypothetical protein
MTQPIPMRLLGEIALPDDEELLVFADATSGADVLVIGVDVVYDELHDRIASPYVPNRWLALGVEGDDLDDIGAEGRTTMEARLAPSLLSVEASVDASRLPRAPNEAEWLGVAQFPKLSAAPVGAAGADQTLLSLALLRTPEGWITAVELAWLGTQREIYDPYQHGVSLRIRGFADGSDIRERVRFATVNIVRYPSRDRS